MPTFIGPRGSGGNPIADAMKNLMQQTSPLNLAHAAYYGAQSAEAQAKAAQQQLTTDSLRRIQANGIFDPNSAQQAGDLIVAKAVTDALNLNRGRNAMVFGAASPQATNAAFGAGMPYRDTGAGFREAESGLDRRSQWTNETSRLNNADTNKTSRLNNADTNTTSRLNNADTNATTLESTRMTNTQSGLNNAATNETSRANNASTTATQIKTQEMQDRAAAERAQAERDDALIDGVDMRDGQTPMRVRAGDYRNGKTPYFRPNISMDNAIGNSMIPPTGGMPQGVLQGGGVPSQIPQAPSFLPQMPAPVSPAQRIALPLAHDLTNTVEVPQPPQPQSIVQPSLTPPPSMVGGAPPQMTAALDRLDPRIANAKGLRYPPALTFIDVAGKRTGTSTDGGRTVMVNGQQIPNDGTFKQAGPETGIAETRTALAQAGIQPFQPADPRVGQIFQSVAKPGVGGIAGFAQQDINNLLGSTGLAALIPGGQFGADQSAARQRLNIFNNQMTKALLGARAAEAGIKEQSKIASILPSAGIFTNPQTEAGKVVQLYGQLMEQNRILVEKLRRPESAGAPFEKLRAMLDDNETALKMITDPAWATKFTGEVMPGVDGGPAQPAGDAIDVNQRPGGPAPAGTFKIIGVRDK